jgi:hypothetical protein
MSPKKKTGSGDTDPAGHTSAANPATPASLTPAQFQDWSEILKKVSDNKWIVRAVLAAGVAAVFEIVHLCWLFGKWVYYFFR